MPSTAAIAWLVVCFPGTSWTSNFQPTGTRTRDVGMTRDPGSFLSLAPTPVAHRSGSVRMMPVSLRWRCPSHQQPVRPASSAVVSRGRGRSYPNAEWRVATVVAAPAHAVAHQGRRNPAA
jgi:hypothetical protein